MAGPAYVLTLGTGLWFAAGLGRIALIVMIVPMVAVRARWDQHLRNYRKAMRRVGQEPFAIRDWALLSDSLLHPCARAGPLGRGPRRRRTTAPPGKSGIGSRDAPERALGHPPPAARLSHSLSPIGRLRDGQLVKLP
jgi:hypothetical protein